MAFLGNKSLSASLNTAQKSLMAGRVKTAQKQFTKATKIENLNNRINSAKQKNLQQSVGYRSLGGVKSAAQSSLNVVSNFSNASLNNISRGLPKRGPYFNKTPGVPMSHSIVQDASQLTVEYR